MTIKEFMTDAVFNFRRFSPEVKVKIESSQNDFLLLEAADIEENLLPAPGPHEKPLQPLDVLPRFVGDNPHRPQLHGIYFDRKLKNVVSTNGSWLAYCSYPEGCQLSGLWKNNEKSIKYAAEISEDYYNYEISDCQIIFGARYKEDTKNYFPTYTRVIPDAKAGVKLDLSWMLEKLDHLRAFDNLCACFKIKEPKIKITMNDQTVYFQADWLRKVLQAFGDIGVTKLTGQFIAIEGVPVVFSGGGLTVLLMPSSASGYNYTPELTKFSRMPENMDKKRKSKIKQEPQNKKCLKLRDIAAIASGDGVVLLRAYRPGTYELQVSAAMPANELTGEIAQCFMNRDVEKIDCSDGRVIIWLVPVA